MSERPRRYVVMRISVRGRVQGVGYRAFVEQVALENGLEGWVRNRLDGSVDAVFAGAPDAVHGAVERCLRGPLGAKVDDLQTREGTRELLSPCRPGERFSVLPTI